MTDSIFLNYLTAFYNLKRGVTKYGKAPHKVVLLISILQAFRNKLINDNCISISPELVALFRHNWSVLVTTPHVCNFALPFWHLKSEGFWHLVSKPEMGTFLNIKESVSSINELNAIVDYAMLDKPLFSLMNNTDTNLILHNHLLNYYFENTRNSYVEEIDAEKKIFDAIENKILNECPVDYRQEIMELIAKKDEEEMFLRGSLFKREIPKIYNNTCCISGMKIDATINISMIDACHIVPFSISYDDTVTNGIALCPNLHRAFDRGLISVDDEYKVVVSNVFNERNTAYGIREFEGKEIRLPSLENYFPLKDNFKWHRENTFKY